MDRLPPEILNEVVDLACTDGGQTASALRLMNHTIHDVAGRYRFRSVAVSGVDALDRLAEALEQAPIENANVEHLFVCDLPCSRAENHSELGHAGGRAVQSRVDGPADHVPGTQKRFEHHLRRILQSHRAHLRSLTILLIATNTGADILSLLAQTTFPGLMTFTLKLANATSYHDLYIMLLSSSQANFPHLRAFTLDVPCYVPARSLSCLTTRAPAIRDITIVCVNMQPQLEAFLADFAKGNMPTWSLDYQPCLDPTRALSLDDTREMLAAIQQHANHLANNFENVRVHVRGPRPTYREWLDEWLRTVEADV